MNTILEQLFAHTFIRLGSTLVKMSFQEICKLVKAESGKRAIQVDQAQTIISGQSQVGQIAFDFGEVLHSMIGQGHVKGKFSRLLPRVQRPLITADELEIMVRYLQSWLKQYFETALPPKYFNELVETTCLFAYYAYPFPPIESLRMKLYLQLLVFLYLLDDTVEPGSKPKFTYQLDTLNRGLDILLRVFQSDDSPKSVVLDNFPVFSEMYSCAVDISYSLRQQGYSTAVFCKLLEQYFNSMRCRNLKPFDDTDSEEDFFAWRKIDVYCDGTIEVAWFLESEQPLPPIILKSTSFQRLLDLTNGISSCMNDLLGFKKDLKNGEVYSIVIFKVCQKKISLNSTIAQVCKLINDSLEAYLILKKEILNEFLNHPGLLHYIDILESTIFDHSKFYLSADRYCAVGHITFCEAHHGQDNQIEIKQ